MGLWMSCSRSTGGLENRTQEKRHRKFFLSKSRSQENVRDPKNSIRKLLALVEREERKVFDFL